MNDYDFQDTDFAVEVILDEATIPPFDPYEVDEYEDDEFDESYIDYYAESSLFGWDS